MTCLHQACINGNLDLVKLLIDCGAQIDLKDSNGFTPLHYACQHLKLELVTLFLRYGINPNEPTYRNDTPLHLVVQYSPINSINNTPEKIVLHLLTNGGYFSLASSNKSGQTPFELGCELGKIKLIDIILKYCAHASSNSDKLNLIRNYSKNCLNLASKNAHDDIIRLLLIYKIVDLNYMNKDGSALHDACRYGRLQTVKLLLEAGIDMNIKNSSNQLAIDVIIKQKIGNDIKCLLKEYSQSVRALSIKPYGSNHAGALNFDSNEMITVLDKTNQIHWRGFILDKSNYTTRSGYFPSSHVQLLLNDHLITSPPKRPLITSSTNSLLKLTETDNLSLFDSSQFDFKDSIYLSNTYLDKIQKNSIVKGPNLSPSSSSSISSSSSSSYCTNNFNVRRKVNFSEEASTDADTDIYGPLKINKVKSVGDMLRSGLSDSQIIFNWLKEFGLEQYYENFVKSGYDLITIMKCCPADLCAIGISDPTHRQLVKQAISLLDISEIETKLNQYLVKIASIDELLKLIHLEQYSPILKQLYKTFDEFINTLSWEDLEESGVKKLGHQKKLMFVTKKLKEITNLRLNASDSQVQDSNGSIYVPIQLNQLAKSLENLSGEQRLFNKPALPKRINTFKTENYTNESPSKHHPPLPPRISSVVLPKDLVSSYATLPRNKKSSSRLAKEINCLNEERPNSASSSSPPISSTSSSPNSTSPNSNNKYMEPNSILVPPTPPPMPLMSIPTTNSVLAKKSPRRPLMSDICLEESYNKINSNLKLNSVLNRPTGCLATNMNNTQGFCLSSNSSKLNNDKGILNDIDSMLCDLNKQLDAMLDYEQGFKA